MPLRTMLILLALPLPAQAQTACRAEIGPARAQVLVDRCLQASPATHPPCNAFSPCEMIRAEIARGCAYIASGPATADPPHPTATSRRKPSR